MDTSPGLGCPRDLYGSQVDTLRDKELCGGVGEGGDMAMNKRVSPHDEAGELPQPSEVCWEHVPSKGETTIHLDTLSPLAV